MTTPPPAPPVSSPPSSAPERLSGARPPRRGWLRAGTRTEPGRLRWIGAVVAGLLLLFGALTAWQVTERAATSRTVLASSQPLSADAAGIYRSLTDANTTAANGFLAGSNEPRGVRERYEESISTAAALIASAASDARSEEVGEQITQLNELLARYTGLVETARANNRQGLPLGGAYLRRADTLMQESLLPVAERLYALETERFRGDLDDARDWPAVALGVGVLTLGVLGWSQRRHYRRTNRMFNPGLLAATGLAVVLLGWLAGAHGLARHSLHHADQSGAQSLDALHEAWTGALQARGDENMALVVRGAGGNFQDSYQEHMDRIIGPVTDPGGTLGEAFARADDDIGRRAVREAMRSAEAWRGRHAEAMEREGAGDYETAVSMVISERRSTAETFDRVDASLDEAVTHEQAQFEEAARTGHRTLTGLAPGAAVLAVLAAGAAVAGVGRRLAEYR